MKMHPTITVDRVMEAVKRHNTSLDNPGFCVECGEEAMECEPDTRRGECEFCEKSAVYGADELLIMIA